MVHPTWRTLLAPAPATTSALLRDPFDRNRTLGTATCYLPGAGTTDGDSMRVFCSTGACQVAVHADYAVTPEQVVEVLNAGRASGGVAGYKPCAVQWLAEHEVMPSTWESHVSTPSVERRASERTGAYAAWVVLQREPGFGDEHGPQALGLLHVMDDAVRLFDALWCQGAGEAPVAVVIQNHGFGLQRCSWGADGPLARLANVFAPPRWLLVAEGTTPWAGYESLGTQGATGRGGMHGTSRQLFQRSV